MKQIIVVVLLALLAGCASSQFVQKESPQMLQIQEECKRATIDKARLTQMEASDAYWNDIWSLPEYRDFYEKCLRDKGYIKQK